MRNADCRFRSAFRSGRSASPRLRAAGVVRQPDVPALPARAVHGLRVDCPSGTPSRASTPAISKASRGRLCAVGAGANIAFFPVYPLLMRAVADSSAGNTPSSTSRGSGSRGCVSSWRWSRCITLHVSARPARGARGAADDVFPFSFFYGVAYSESTFLLFVALAFYLFRTRRWGLGGLCGAIATARGCPRARCCPRSPGWHGRRPADPPRSHSARSSASLSRPAVSSPMRLYLSADRPPVPMAGDDRAMGVPPWRSAVDDARHSRAAARHASVTYLTTNPMAVYDTSMRDRDPVCARRPVRVAALRRGLRRV